MHNNHKKVSLITKFIVMFTVFGVISTLVCGIFTFMTQTRIYHNECESNLKNITDQLNSIIQDDGEDFIDVLDYFKEHRDEMHIKPESAGDYQPELLAFRKLFAKKYPNKTYGVDITFSEMDDDLQKVYAEYKVDYWMTMFSQASESFNLAYTYFIYPDPEPDITYFIDPLPETKEVNGEEYYSLGFHGFEDPEKYKMVWEAWHTGKNPSGFDVFDNEFGYTYAYYSPVWIDSEEIGLVCAEISVERVHSTIIHDVLLLSTGMIVAIVIGIFIMVMLLRKIFLYRILNLEKNIALYSNSKNVSLAGAIQQQEQGDDEIRSLSDQFASMITELKNYMDNLQQVTAEKERIGAELSVATTIQEGMLPRIFPPYPDRKEFDLYASMDPAKEVGGDFYDFFMVDEDHIALVMADVSGKGVPAALFMVIAKTLIKNAAQMGKDPSETLEYANDQLADNEGQMFVTVWMAIIEISTGKGIAANAGHEHPALRHENGKYELVVYRHSPAVATMEGIPFRQHEFELQPGDSLFVYTDGVPEATDAHDELFGTDRMIEALNQDPDASQDVVLANVRKAVDAFVKDAPQFDDLTMLGFKYYGVEGKHDS